MSEAFEEATQRVYDALTGEKPDQVRKIIAAREEVLERYGPLFTPENAREIEEHEFTSFLHFRNNKQQQQALVGPGPLDSAPDQRHGGAAGGALCACRSVQAAS